MIVDVYHLKVSNSEGHQETHELRVQADSSPTLVSVISERWLADSQYQLLKAHSYQYSELADYESRMAIAQQGYQTSGPIHDSRPTAISPEKVAQSAITPD